MARLVDVEQVVFSLAAHIQQHQVQAVVGHAVQQLAGMDLHLTRVQHGLLDSLLARPLLSRGRLADEDHGQCSHHQQRRAGIAGLRLFGQVALAKDVLQLLAAPEHEQRHQHHQQHHHAVGQVQPIHQREAAHVPGGLPPAVVQADGFAEHEDAEEPAQHEEQPVQLAGHHPHQRGAGAEAADDEADAHDQPAQDARPQVGGVDPHLVVVQQPQANRKEDQYHRHHNGGEHHLEHGQFFEVELRRQLFGIAKARDLQHVAEAKTDQAEDEVHQRLANQSFKR